MRKRNYLLAGCLLSVLHATSVAAEELQGYNVNIPSDTSGTITTEENKTKNFGTINLEAGNNTTTNLSINSSYAPVSINTANLNGNNVIEFAPAIQDILFNTVNISGVNNTIEHSTTSIGNVDIKDININSDAQITLNSNNGTINYNTITLENGAGSNTQLNINGNNQTIEKARINSNGDKTNININNVTFKNSYQENIDGAVIFNKGTAVITDSSFVNNTNSRLNGGAIYSEGELTVNATNKDVFFQGNRADKGADIYLANGSDLNLNTALNRTMFFNGGIAGTNGSEINVDGEGKIIADAQISNAMINLKGGELKLTNEQNFNSVNLTVDNSTSSSTVTPTINILNNATGTLTTPVLSINGTMDLKIDADLAANLSDKVLSVVAGANSGTINIKNINILSDAASATTKVLETAGSNSLTVDSSLQALTSNYLYDVTANGNNLEFTQGAELNGVQSAIQSMTGERYLSVLENNNIEANFKNHTGATTAWTGEMGEGELTIYGNGNSLDGLSVFNGITVKNDDKLNIQDLGTSTSPVKGFKSDNGAFINNSGTLNIQNSYFQDNVANINGGVISNSGNAIIKDTIFNKNTATGGFGGAIHNTGDLELENSIFTENTANYGGAIHNTGSLIVKGEQFTSSNNIAIQGGALYNDSSSQVNIDIPAVIFSNNTATGLGGAIANYNGTITFNGTNVSHNGIVDYGTVTFDGNYATNGGGAIYNTGANSVITSNANWIVSGKKDDISTSFGGGSIYNSNGALLNLEANNTFYENYSDNFGGAILNDNATITMGSEKTYVVPAIPADPSGCGEGTQEIRTTEYTTHVFANNEVKKSGAALANINGGKVSMTALNTEWKENRAWESGSAIYNKESDIVIDTISENTFDTNSGERCGGAIFNETANFTMTTGGNNNFVCNDSGLCGGAIFNTNEGDMYIYAGGGLFSSTANNTPGNWFYQNVASTNGGAIFNKDAYIHLSTGIGGITKFEENQGHTGGAIYSRNDIDSTKTNVKIDGGADFTRNSAYNGGAIATENSNIDITGVSFTSNQATVGDGGAIYARDNSNIKLSSANFNSNNSYWTGGAIYLSDSIMTITNGASFTNNTASNNYYNYNEIQNGGGALQLNNGEFTVDGSSSFEYNTANGDSAAGGAISVNATNSDAIVNLNREFAFVGNSATTKGGAIYAGANDGHKAIINLTSYQHSGFEGNTANGDSNAIYLEKNAEVNLYNTEHIEPITNTKYYSDITINDKIAGTEQNNNITQHNGDVYYNNDNRGYAGDYTLLAGNAYFTNPNSYFFNGGNYILEADSALHLNNGRIDAINAKSLTAPSSGHAIINIDLDLTTELSDRFVLENSATGNILVDKINVTGKTDKQSIFYNIAEGADFDSNVKEIKSGLYKYNVLGKKSGLLLYRGTGFEALADTAVLAPSIAVNAYLANQLANYNQMLQRVDEIAEYRYFYPEKNANNNLYASIQDTIDDRVTPYVFQDDKGTGWIKPSITIEEISPEGAGDYDNRAWNTFVGYDMPKSSLKNGWELVNTVFGGYQGSMQKYDSIKNYQNGGAGGYMGSFYKNNFFGGVVAMVGGTAVQTKDHGLDMYNESMDFPLISAGAAARAGYNVGLGKHWLFQPMLTSSYTFISGYDTNNDSGEKAEAKSTNTITIAPGFKLIGNYAGWQPYMLVDYTWPLMAKTISNVNNIDLPDVKLKSWIEYGVGLRKNFGERFTGQAEIVMRNAGRTGVTMQGGFIWKF